MRYFKLEEFSCKCCGKVIMNDNFLTKLDLAREYADVPFKIMSGYRCPKHNAAVGSTSKNHVNGKAVDITCAVGPQRIAILTGLIKAGFKRIGIAESFIHADTMDSEGSPVSCWLY